MQIGLRKSTLGLVIVLVLAGAGLALVPSIEESLGKRDRAHKGKGNEKELVLPLHYSKALSASFTSARGLARLNLESGVFAAMVQGVPDTSRYDVWLVDTRAGHGASVKPEPGDRMIRLGTLRGTGDSRRLVVPLDLEALRGFDVDLVVVAPETRRPGQADLLVGSPTPFRGV